MGSEAGRCVIAIDAGTTGVRSRAVFAEGRRPSPLRTEEFTQIYPQPGWVEHDADEIWQAVATTLSEVVGRGRARRPSPPSASPTSGRPSWPGTAGPASRTARAIVWQDRRTADRCEALARGRPPAPVRETTGLVLDPYFSATKFEWLLARARASRSTPTWRWARSTRG